MSKWVIGGNAIDWGPAKDSGWQYEEKRSELEPIASNTTIVQSTGFKSPKRTIEGTTKSKTLRDAIVALYLARANVSCTDQDGVSFTARLVDVDFPVRVDAANSNNNFQDYDYKIVLMKR